MIRADWKCLQQLIQKRPRLMIYELTIRLFTHNSRKSSSYELGMTEVRRMDTRPLFGQKIVSRYLATGDEKCKRQRLDFIRMGVSKVIYLNESL